MLSVSLYDNTSTVFSFDFVKDINLETIVVCPSPSEADNFRAQMTSIDMANVVTISKFISEQIEENLGELEIMRKSDLMVHLASIWKTKFQESSSESFFQAFTLFTELRSFTLSLEMVEDVLETLDSELADVIRFFWAYLEEFLVDEQKSYVLLNEKLKIKDHEKDKNYIFWGFPHMNAHQVDLLNSLASSSHVYVPYSREVFSHTTRQDWVRWIEINKVEAIEREINQKIPTILYPKGRMSEYLRNFFASKENESFDIVLAEKNPNLESLMEVPFSEAEYRTKAELFDLEEKKAIALLEEFVNETNETKEIITKLKESIKETLKNQDFKLLTVLRVIYDLLREYYDISEINAKFTFFDLKILREVFPLDLPRTYFVPLKTSTSGIQVYGLEGFSENSKKDVLLCVSSQQNSLKGGGQKFSEEITSFLATLGPIQRKELDFLNIKRMIHERCVNQKITLFLEEGLIDHDLAWSDILDGGELINQQEIVLSFNEKSPDVIADKINKEQEIKKLSASRLQNYLDCPRKYYFNYIDRIAPDIVLERDLMPNELGELEHFVLGEFFKVNDELNEDELIEFSREKIDEYLAKKNKVLTKELYEKYESEIVQYAKNGLVELYKLKDVFPKMEYVFEKNLNEFGDFSGSIDFYAKTSLGIVIIDFKRSISSIPDNIELLKFDKIQLWFYINEALKKEGSNLFFAGYMNLSDIENSKFLIPELELVERLSERNFCKGSLKQIRNFEFEESLDEFQDFVEELISRLKVETHFKPKPLKSSVCTYCSVNKICPRK
ncbi:PD-(D/E)XK nuclease family protein [Halobacteriovorax sp. GB3]|uniref:PD-(D/E)XK nuclease family protein n=1 Tax=Halobacteriovorax sp. GB3 TaxID=2719615 RepID=UPI002360C575|nr:PD-(D/E)XK nuclease family protein [Halobacteriovorax sp. GB3]MDD0852421.1 PD-(D/E)XK nuclease family protein [Halobacteriovorax sp. GB3]